MYMDVDMLYSDVRNDWFDRFSRVNVNSLGKLDTFFDDLELSQADKSLQFANIWWLSPSESIYNRDSEWVFGISLIINGYWWLLMVDDDDDDDDDGIKKVVDVYIYIYSIIQYTSPNTRCSLCFAE